MQTRRSFIVNGLVNLAAFGVGGSLVIAGKEKAQELVTDYNQENSPPPQENTNKTNTKALEKSQKRQEENLRVVPKEYTDEAGLPSITVNHAIDFGVGGILGVAVKKVIGKSLTLRQTNKELSSTVKRLQQLEENDLPGIEWTLKEFVRKEGVRFEANENANQVQSILDLLDSISTHVNAHKQAAQPFLEELQKLRTAMSQPFVEQLKDGAAIDAATKDATVQTLRGKKLTEYLETTVVNALENSGDGEKIGKNIVNSLTKKDLVTDEGVNALRQTTTDALKSKAFTDALTNTASNAVSEYDTGSKLIDALMEKLKTSLSDDASSLLALRNAFNIALQSTEFSEQLGKDLENYFDNNTIAEDFLSPLLEKFKNREIKDDDPSLLALGTAFNNALGSDETAEKLGGDISTYLGENDITGDRLSALGERFANSEIKDDDPSLLALGTAFNNALESDTVSEELGKDVDKYLSDNSVGGDLLDTLVEKLKSGKIEDNDPGLVTLKAAFNTALDNDSTSEKLGEDIDSYLSDNNTGGDLLEALVEKLKSGAIENNDPGLVALKTALNNALGSDGVSEKLDEQIVEAVGDSDLAETFIEKLKSRLTA